MQGDTEFKSSEIKRLAHVLCLSTRNLCAQIPIALHDRVCEAREQAGLTTAQYITNLLTEYARFVP